MLLSMRKLLLSLTCLLLFVGIASAQTIVHGVIKDSVGIPVAGATIVVKGANSYAIADGSGQFSISTKKAFPFTLRITSVNYKTQELNCLLHPQLL